MELFPIIYTSLLIAAGIFLVTVIISYISYKVRQNDDEKTVEEAPPPPSEKPVYSYEKKKQPVRNEYKSPTKEKEKYYSERRKEIREDELYRHSSGKSSSSKREKRYTRDEGYNVKAPSSVRRTEPERRIEILKDLKTRKGEERPQELPPIQNKETETNRQRQQKTSSDEEKERKNLKSIEDDPLNKYSDSSDNDDFQPLKTDD